MSRLLPDTRFLSPLISGLFLILIFLILDLNRPPAEEPTPEALSTATVEPSPTPPETTPTPTLTPTATPLPQTSTTTPAPSPTVTQETPEPRASRLPILEYHHSEYQMNENKTAMTAEWFVDQMEWLSEHDFDTLTAQELVDYVDGKAAPTKRSVVLTFDIGTGEFENFSQVIVPTLRKYDLHALFFILLNAISEDGANNTISWSDLRQWQEEGVISVESHGVYHPDYQQLEFQQMVWDAKTSYDIIKRQLGRAPLIFAYPFDSVPEKADILMERVGYSIALAGHRSDRSVRFADPDRYALPRYYPYSNDEAYPIIVDGQGRTFPEMMLSAISPDEEQVEVAFAIQPTPSIRLSSDYIPPSLKTLTNFCRSTTPETLYMLDTHAQFPTDISSCAQRHLKKDVLVKPTCFFGPPIVPEAIVLHSTYGPYQSTVNQFRESEQEASAHYIIDRDGTITQMVPEYFGSYHVTCYGTRSLCKSSCPICEDSDGRLTPPWTRSIGIELVNVGQLRGSPGEFRNPDGTEFEGLVFEDYLASWSYRYWEDYPTEQIDALRILVEDIMARWNIDLDRVIGHSLVQPEKIDPGPALNLTWRRYGDPPRDPIFSPSATLSELEKCDPTEP